MTVGLFSFALLFGNPATAKSVVNGFGGNAFPYVNLIKGATFNTAGTFAYPGILNADGYPTTAPSTSIVESIPVDTSYFGHYIFSFTGTGAYRIDAPGFIVFSGSGFDTGSVNFALIVQASNPTIEFALGSPVASPGAVNNGSGLIRLNVRDTSQMTTGETVKVESVGGTTEANGTWTITVVNSTQIDLQGSTFVHAWTSGGAVIVSASQLQGTLPSTGTYGSGGTQMANLILCEKANQGALSNGQNINPDLVAKMGILNPKWLRFMDLTGTPNQTSTNWTYRPQTSARVYSEANWVSSYWAGTISRGVSDAYTCSNPSASPASGAYVDGEIVQGQIDLANLTMTPTLALSGRSGGAKPIFSNTCTLQTFALGGSVAISDTISVVFTGSYITGSPYTLHVISSSTSLGTLAAQICNAINADATLTAANITADGNGNLIIYNKNAGSGTTFSGSSTGSTTFAFGTLAISTFSANDLWTFTYSKIVDGWIMSATTTGLNQGCPIETAIELCNRANIGLWLNIPFLYSQSSVVSLVALVRDTLNSNLPFSLEFSNEVWNFVQSQTRMAQSLGACLGLVQPSARAIYGFYGLRVRQFMEQAISTWTTSRSRATLYCVNAVQLFGSPSDNQTYRFNGSDLNASGTGTNATLKAFGGPGGASLSVDYSTFPNRPIDFCDLMSPATYFDGGQVQAFLGEYAGTLSWFSGLISAASSYASGGAGITTGLNFLFNSGAVTGDLYNGSLNGVAQQQSPSNLAASIYPGWSTVAATYDTQRAGQGLSVLGVAAYEGAHEWCPLASDLSGMTAQLNAMGDGSAAPDAQNIINLLAGFKNDARLASLVTKVFTDFANGFGTRPVYPGWYATDGPNIWAIYPGSIYTTPYQSYNAISAYNR